MISDSVLFPHFGSRLLRALGALGFALVLLLTSPVSLAYTNQWDWKVMGIWRNGSQVVGSITFAYPTKAEAVARMRELLPPEGALLTEESVISMSDTSVIYKYSTPRKNSNYGPWVIEQGYTEASFLAEKIAKWTAFCQAAPIVSGGEEWITSGDTPLGPIVQYKIWRFDITAGDTSGCLEGPQLTFESLGRTRTISCPTGHFHGDGLTVEPACVYPSFLEGRVIGHLHEDTCEKTKVGDPCDAATGAQSESETDYSAAGLEFTRYYDSATLPSHGGLGTGWTHNYAGRLVLSSGSPQGLVRPNGNHDVLTFQTDRYIGQAGRGIKVVASGAQWIAHLPGGRREVYDSTGRLIQLVSASGALTTLAYGPNGMLASVQGPYGHRLLFSFNEGFLSSVADPAGGTIAYAYNTAGSLAAVTYQDNTSRNYLYENAAFRNHLTGIVDESGVRTLTVNYDTMGRVSSSGGPGGANAVSLVYNPTNTVVTDAAGGVTTYNWSSTSSTSRRLSSSVKGSITTSYVLGSDLQRRVTQSTDRRGTVTQYTYDRDHLLSITEAFGETVSRTTTFQYNSSFDDRVTLETGPLSSTAATFDSGGNELTRTVTDSASGESRTWSRTYSATGQLLTDDGPRTDVSDLSTYIYYTCATGGACGQPLSITNALGHAIHFDTYNGHGQPLALTDTNGVVTTLTYDLRARLTARQVGSQATTYTYWPTGLLKRVIQPDGSYVEYGYDGAHRLNQITDGGGNRIQYTLDGMGNRIGENAYDPSDSLARASTAAFNSLNQLWKQIGAAGTPAVTTTFGYNGNGNTASVQAPLGRNSLFGYDRLNRLGQIIDADSGITWLGYDANDRLKYVIDPQENTTDYSYNGFGDLLERSSPDTGVTTHTYQPGGNLETVADARDALVTYTYDALNRPITATYQRDGATDQQITYTYDTGSNGIGRLRGTSDSKHSLTWTYDAQGHVTSKTQVSIGSTASTKTIGYAYANDRLTTVTLPSGQAIGYSYVNGRIAGISLNGSTAILNQVLYEPFGGVRQWAWGNGSLAVRTHDLDGRIAQIDAEEFYTLSYDDAGRVAGITNDDNPSQSWAYGYDTLDRLSSASRASASFGWSYDANGNRQTQTGTSAISFTQASDSNRLASTSGSLARTYAYDAAGNTTGYSNLVFGYNNRGRIEWATVGSISTDYAYNALGELIRKSNSGAKTHLVYDEAGHLVGEYNAVTGALIQETVWLGDIPVATLRPNGSSVDVFYVHTDQLNTPRKVTQPGDNAVRWRWDPQPFGASTPNQNPQGLGTFSYNLRFPGQYYQAETGLHYNYFRDYDPSTGRYIESDPIGLEGGINTYAYAAGNPAIFSDPWGLWAAVTVSGNNVSITLPIQYSGLGATPERIRDWNNAIQRSWSGQFGKYRVTTSVTRGTQNQIDVPCENGQAVTDRIANTGTWPAFGPKGYSSAEWMAAHEAGHLMGLLDKYVHWSGRPFPGWEHDIMGAVDQAPSARDIADIINWSQGK